MPGASAAVTNSRYRTGTTAAGVIPAMYAAGTDVVRRMRRGATCARLAGEPGRDSRTAWRRAELAATAARSGAPARRRSSPLGLARPDVAIWQWSSAVGTLDAST